MAPDLRLRTGMRRSNAVSPLSFLNIAVPVLGRVSARHVTERSSRDRCRDKEARPQHSGNHPDRDRDPGCSRLFRVPRSRL